MLLNSYHLHTLKHRTIDFVFASRNVMIHTIHGDLFPSSWVDYPLLRSNKHLRVSTSDNFPK
jgi:hypothetical protein